MGDSYRNLPSLIHNLPSLIRNLQSRIRNLPTPIATYRHLFQPTDTYFNLPTPISTYFWQLLQNSSTNLDIRHHIADTRHLFWILFTDHGHSSPILSIKIIIFLSYVVQPSVQITNWILEKPIWSFRLR